MAGFPMPDGRSLAQHLSARAHAEDTAASELGHGLRRARVGTKRGKDLVMLAVSKQRAQLASRGTGADGFVQDAAELAELRALESVGARRRQRWFNDRLLREMAGPMTGADMRSQFNPVPFGWREPSALEVIARPEHAQVWEGFRNIDSDQQDRLLQRWEAHNLEDATTKRASTTSAAEAAARATGEAQQGSSMRPAAQALQRWGRMGRKTRAALRKAKLHTVLGLESQLLDWLETEPEAMGRGLALPLLDAWGKRLVQALAEFWGLSAGTDRDEEKAVFTVHQKQPLQAATSTCVTCHDVLSALAAAIHEGQDLTERHLAKFIHVHADHDSLTAGWVMV